MLCISQDPAMRTFVHAVNPLSGNCWAKTRVLSRFCSRTCRLSMGLPTLAEGQRVVSVGLVCVDLVATVGVYPPPDAKIRTTDYVELCGGNAANTAVAMARLGGTGSTSFLGTVGSDSRGITALDALRDAGVDVSDVNVLDGARTPFTIVVVDSSTGSRTCMHTPAQGLALSQNLGGLLTKAAVVTLDGRYPDDTIRIGRMARAQKLPVLLDVERVRERIDDLLSCATGVVVKASAALALEPNRESSSTDVHEALIRMVRNRDLRWVVCTQGEGGCVLVQPFQGDIDETEKQIIEYGIVSRRVQVQDDMEVVEFDALANVTVRDSTGAGDAFFGALGFALAAGNSLRNSIALAAVVGGMTCEGVGAQSSPTRAEVVARIKKSV